MDVEQVKQIARAYLQRKAFPTLEDVKSVAEQIIASPLIEVDCSLSELVNLISSDMNIYQAPSTVISDDEDGAIDFLANELESFGANVSNHYGEEFEEDEVNPTDDSDSGDIYPIQKILYDTNHSDYSKETIVYYDGDSTFVDAQTDIILEDWKEHLGDDIFNWIEDHDFSNENLCVRNDAMESDYEIIFKETAYSVESGESDDADEYAPGDFADRR